MHNNYNKYLYLNSFFFTILKYELFYYQLHAQLQPQQQVKSKNYM